MYTKRIYSPAIMARWTWRESLVFVLISVVPVVLYDVLEQRWLHLPWLPIALVGTAVAFILGFQNNATYDRIWEARKIWGGIVNTSRAWGLMVNDFIGNQFAEQPASDEELRQIRKRLVMRHVGWLTALRHAMREPRPWEVFQSQASNRAWSEAMVVREHNLPIEEDLRGYLDEDDRSWACARTNRAAQILARQSRELRELRERGLIEDFRHMEMQGVLNQLLTEQGRSERIKNFPYPRQYATLNSSFVWVFLFLLPFGLVHEFHAIGAELPDDYAWISRGFVWLSVPFSVVVMWVFHTMKRVGEVGENPFEGSSNDVPITTMSRGIEIDLRQMIGDDPASIPEPETVRHGTQM